jgi:membrane protease YdiL (CAAX protease family)
MPQRFHFDDAAPLEYSDMNPIEGEIETVGNRRAFVPAIIGIVIMFLFFLSGLVVQIAGNHHLVSSSKSPKSLEDLTGDTPKQILTLLYSNEILLGVIALVLALVAAKLAKKKLRTFLHAKFSWINLWRDLGYAAILVFLANLLDVAISSFSHLFSKADTGNVTALTHSQKVTSVYVALLICTVIAAPIIEETLFRGVIFQGIKGKWGSQAGRFISAFAFSLAHYQGDLVRDLTTMPTIFILGYFLARRFEKTGRLQSNISIHMLNNLLPFLFLVL